MKNYTFLFFYFLVMNLPAQTAQEWFAEGKKSQAEKNHAKAVEWFEKAQTLDKKNPEIPAQLCLSLIQLARYSKAVSAAKAAQRLAPKEGKYVYYQAVALDSMGRDLDVLEVTAKALKLQSDISDLYVLRANIYLDKKEYNTAIANLNKALELDTKNGLAYMKRGYAKDRVVDSTGACADWRKALSLGVQEAQEMLDKNCKE